VKPFPPFGTKIYPTRTENVKYFKKHGIKYATFDNFCFVENRTEPQGTINYRDPSHSDTDGWDGYSTGSPEHFWANWKIHGLNLTNKSIKTRLP
jgi:hypothetical protein